MYRFEEISSVHLEISSLCNARCPMCLRNISGGKINPQLPLKDLRLPEIQQIFTADFLKQLKRIYLCGNYGDPATARDTLPTLEYFHTINPELKLELFSNGSVRNEDWWRELAKLKVNAFLGIDGIGETNAIYRRNTNFEIILQNVRAFIDAGGKAYWDFIVFRHNEHQVEEARELSKQLGFHAFRLKKTGRFFSNPQSLVKDRQEVLDEGGRVEYYLELPSNPEFINPSLRKERGVEDRHGSFDAYFDQTEISCKVAQEKSIYISAEGLAFPCCWLALQLYPWYQKPKSAQIWNLIRDLPEGLDSLNALKQPLSDIVAGPFFQNHIPKSWDRPNVKEGKLKVCAKICGKEFDSFKDQYK